MYEKLKDSEGKETSDMMNNAGKEICLKENTEWSVLNILIGK